MVLRRNPGRIGSGFSPEMDPLRSDPRYPEMLRRMNRSSSDHCRWQGVENTGTLLFDIQDVGPPTCVLPSLIRQGRWLPIWTCRSRHVLSITPH